MKEIAIPITIMLVIGLLCTFTINFTNDICTSMSENLKECSQKVLSTDWESAHASLKKTQAEYDKKLSHLKTFLTHQELFEIQDMFVRIDTTISIKDQKLSIIEINTLISMLDTLSVLESATLSNII